MEKINTKSRRAAQFLPDALLDSSEQQHKKLAVSEEQNWTLDLKLAS